MDQLALLALFTTLLIHCCIRVLRRARESKKSGIREGVCEAARRRDFHAQFGWIPRVIHLDSGQIPAGFRLDSSRIAAEIRLIAQTSEHAPCALQTRQGEV